MAGLDAEPENVAWHKLCDPMQVASDTSNDGVGAWTVLERAYYNA